MIPTIIIGITGTHASGKNTVAEYISQKYNLKSYSTSDEIRYEAAKRGMESTRTNLFKLGNEIRTEFGPGELAKRALNRVSQKEKAALITAIRNIGEVKYLRQHANLYLVSVDGPIETRYKRIMQRKRAGEQTQTFEEFRAAEEKEMNFSEVGQQLIPCMRAADYFIINDSSLEELEKRTQEVAQAIMHSARLS